MDNLLFCEYLLDHFRNCADRYNSSILNYQLEYIIMGKYSDEQKKDEMPFWHRAWGHTSLQDSTIEVK